jgi:4-hydroxy-tetrahydrodipicolinate synthase
MSGAVPFGGLGVALITILRGDGSVDAEGTAMHAARLADRGVRMVLVCGSTGEAWALSPDERVRIISATRSTLPAGVPLLAGTGADGVNAAVELTTQARDAGADAILALSPPGSADLVGYYAAIARAAGPLPVLAYHFPTMSAPGIPLEVLPRLPIAGLKDSTRDVARVTAELTDWDGSVFVGSASMLGLVHSLGGAGAILALANCEPELCLAALAGDGDAQGALDNLNAEANRDFPLGVKELTARRFGTSTTVRSVRPRA